MASNLHPVHSGFESLAAVRTADVAHLSNALSPAQANLIRDVVAEAVSNPDVVGVMLQGSLARGDGYPGSDIDLFVLLKDGRPHSFVAEEREGILVEQHCADYARASGKLHVNPMLAYGFLDGRILRDDSGGLERLRHDALEVVDAYRVPAVEREGILHWLKSTRVKILAAREAGDLLKASFVTATSSWKILEGVWAANDLPMPPNGTVLSRRLDLMLVPDRWEELFDRLFTGDTPERIEAAILIVDYLLALP